jgi:hypothetical protein
MDEVTGKTAKGLMSKFMGRYEGVWCITKTLPPSSYEISRFNGRVRGVFHKQALKL